MAEAKKMKVILIRHTLSPEETVALAPNCAIQNQRWNS